MSLHLLPDDLGHVPSDPSDQDFLLRLLCHVARLDGRVHRQEVAFIEALAEKMGRAEWEFPENDAPVAVSEIARLHACWPRAEGKLWVAGLLRRLAAVDGCVHPDENLFLEAVAGRLFTESAASGNRTPREQLTPDEQSLVAAAVRAAALADTRLWHRKTQKVVGAALGVEHEGVHHVFSGINFELSQPTGSRCAEQVALGAALVHFSDRLRYADVRRVAVVAGPNVPSPVRDPLLPCGVCCEMLRKLDEQEGQLELYMLAAGDPSVVLRVPFSEYYPPHVR